MGSIRQFSQRVSQGYTRFIDHHGLGFIVSACVAVIIGSAAWSNTHPLTLPQPPAFPTEEAHAAAELLQESLADAVRPTATPTAEPARYAPPLSAVSVLTPFDAARLQQSSVSGLWQLHDAVDLAVSPGEMIRAVSSGTVLDVYEDSLCGACAVIDHGDQLIAYYMGMEAAAGLQPGDPVSLGQTVGFGGAGPADEADLPPHLHLRITRDGAAIDPLSIWKTSAN